MKKSKKGVKGKKPLLHSNEAKSAQSDDLMTRFNQKFPLKHLSMPKDVAESISKNVIPGLTK